MNLFASRPHEFQPRGGVRKPLALDPYVGTTADDEANIGALCSASASPSRAASAVRRKTQRWRDGHVFNAVSTLPFIALQNSI